MADNWQPFPLPDGSYSDPTRPWSHQDLVNYLPVRAEMPGSVSAVNRRTAPGLKLHARLGAGPIRGARDVEGRKFFVSGTTFYEVRPDGTPIELGTVPGTGPVQMTHNQVAGGNQIVIVNGSAGYLYDTRDDSLINPSTPDEGDDSEPTTPGGGTPSTGLGPNGGYPDDDPYYIPPPDVFGSDVMPGGDFSDPGDIDAWRTREDGDLAAGYSITGDKLSYSGAESAPAYCFGARFSLPIQPFPRYDVTVTMKVETSANMYVGVGVAWGTSGAGDAPNYQDISAPAAYATETLVTHTFRHADSMALPNGSGGYIVYTFLPVIWPTNMDGLAATFTVDDATITIDEVVTPSTVQTLAHLDFDAGLTGWTTWPPNNPNSPNIEVDSGELVMTTTSAAQTYAAVICDDPIVGIDATGKYVGASGEVWSNDPTLLAGVPTGGVAFAVVPKIGGAYYPPDISKYIPQRGDWTPRDYWERAYDNPTATWHLAIVMRAALGYQAKARSLEVRVTDDVID